MMPKSVSAIAKPIRLGMIASALALAVPMAASAAFIAIDDSDPATITITAGDFEGGLSVDGTLLTTGLGSSGSVTLPDGGYSIDGSWIDLGGSSGALDILFALAVAPTDVTSGLDLAGTTDGFFGTIVGSFGGFTGIPYFSTGLPTTLQDGHTEFGAFPFLSISFTSEAAVPEPASLALLGLGLAAMAAVRRRKSS